jgi:hypothetical protein
MKGNRFGVLGRHVHPWKYKENHKGMYKTNYRKLGKRKRKQEK